MGMSAGFAARGVLLQALVRFVDSAKSVRGVTRIAVIGSLITSKPDPKDADVLVTVEGDADLAKLAALGRRLKGEAQCHNLGADIFLASAQGLYIGRTCSYRECRPRLACRGTQCRPGNWICNDFHEVRLAKQLVAEPPLELWPRVAIRAALPKDILRVLLERT